MEEIRLEIWIDKFIEIRKSFYYLILFILGIGLGFLLLPGTPSLITKLGVGLNIAGLFLITDLLTWKD